MQAARLREKDPTLRRHGGETAENISETRSAGLTGMGTLDRLRKLHGVADENNVARSSAGRDDIGERNLTCLVDEQIVELLIVLGASKKPGGPGHERTSGQAGIIIVLGDLDRRIR